MGKRRELKEGMLVQRGVHWDWGAQDEHQGHNLVGLVLRPITEAAHFEYVALTHNKNVAKLWWEVVWLDAKGAPRGVYAYRWGVPSGSQPVVKGGVFGAEGEGHAKMMFDLKILPTTRQILPHLEGLSEAQEDALRILMKAKEKGKLQTEFHPATVANLRKRKLIVDTNKKHIKIPRKIRRVLLVTVFKHSQEQAKTLKPVPPQVQDKKLDAVVEDICDELFDITKGK